MRKKLFLLILMAIIFVSNSAYATVTGVCSNCHTMHNTDNGSQLVAEGVSRSLTKGDCVGCHTGTAATGSGGTIPMVNITTENFYGPDYNSTSGVLSTTNLTLAGGTFGYIGDNPKSAHNVYGIAADGAIEPPGWIDTAFKNTADKSVADTWDSKQLTCAGTNGCHGNHAEIDDFADIRGAHHGDDSTIDGDSVATSYRFLRGILGYEDPDWELTVSATDHNTYYGVDRIKTTGVMDKQTISYLCAQCHGLFHSNDGTSTDRGINYDDDAIGTTDPWLRHPTDFSLSATGDTEYTNYADASGTIGGNTYNYVAPLATENVNDALVNNNSTARPAVISEPFTTTTGDNDIVTCLSCHRAHGSPYDDMLRWDYANMNAGSGGNFANKGCFACHTTKD